MIWRIINKMQVDLIQYTPDPLQIIYTACRACYSSSEVNKIYSSVNNIQALNSENKLEEMKELVLRVLNSGHNSVLEHIYLTFTIDGISRASANQLVRHRHCSYSQQSLRYVEVKEDLDELETIKYENNTHEQLYDVCDKYFVNPYNINNDELKYFIFANNCLDSLINYTRLICSGAKPEDARGVLGLNFKTNIMMSCNLREFIHICNLRLCKRAQGEIREMTQKMVKEVNKNIEYEFLKPFLKAKCKTCTEVNKCK